MREGEEGPLQPSILKGVVALMGGGEVQGVGLAFISSLSHGWVWGYTR